MKKRVVCNGIEYLINVQQATLESICKGVLLRGESNDMVVRKTDRESCKD